MRIVSLLPSATEICFAIGLGDQLVGVTHECDYPPEAAGKPVVTRATRVAPTMPSAQIDAIVAEQLGTGGELYAIDEATIERLAPDLILTQQLCEVCAISLGEVEALAARLPTRPRVISLDPYSLQDMLENIRTVGEATGHLRQAEKLIAWLQTRLDLVEERTADLARPPRVFCLEWLDPPWSAGHWIPEMVQLAGGEEVIGGLQVPWTREEFEEPGQRSVRTTWAEIARQRPEVLIVMPCGFNVERALQEIDVLRRQPEFTQLPAVQAGEVYVVDGSSYFNRPGPRLVDGVEILAQILHPDLFVDLVPEGAAVRATWRSLDEITPDDLARQFAPFPG